MGVPSRATGFGWRAGERRPRVFATVAAGSGGRCRGRGAAVVRRRGGGGASPIRHLVSPPQPAALPVRQLVRRRLPTWTVPGGGANRSVTSSRHHRRALPVRQLIRTRPPTARSATASPVDLVPLRQSIGGKWPRRRAIRCESLPQRQRARVGDGPSRPSLKSAASGATGGELWTPPPPSAGSAASGATRHELRTPAPPSARIAAAGATRGRGRDGRRTGRPTGGAAVLSRRSCDSAPAGTAPRSTSTGRPCPSSRCPSSRRTAGRPAMPPSSPRRAG
jgi:hypothetical protein